MENTNNNQGENKSSYRFSPEKAGMRDKFYPVYSLTILGIIIKFLPSILRMFGTRYLFGVDIYTLPKVYFTYGAIICVVIAIFLYIKLKVYMSTTHYILTPQRLTVESGFLSKSVSNLELWRVTDIQIRQTIAQKSFGACTVQLVTTDVSDPLVNIDGLPYKKGRELYEVMSEYVNDSIKNGGIMRKQGTKNLTYYKRQQIETLLNANVDKKEIAGYNRTK